MNIFIERWKKSLSKRKALCHKNLTKLCAIKGAKIINGSVGEILPADPTSRLFGAKSHKKSAAFYSQPCRHPHLWWGFEYNFIISLVSVTINVNNINQCIINLLKEDGMEVSLRPKYINTFMHTNQPLRLLMDRHELTSATLNSCLLPSKNPQSLAKLGGKGNKCPEAQNETYLGSYLALFFKKKTHVFKISLKKMHQQGKE